MKYLMLAALVFTELSFAQEPIVYPNFKYWASFRVRAENEKESNLANSKSPTYLRLRPGIEWQVQPKISLVGEAQAVKSFGSEVYTPSSTTANSRQRSSGYNYDNEIYFHQGFLKYLLNEEFEFHLGRKILNYGDSLLIGDSDWHNTGRSFDAVTARYRYNLGWVEAFTAKLVDRSVTTDQPGNEDLTGLYLHFDFGNAFTNVDPYIFNYQNSTNVDGMYEVWSYGLRTKSKYNNFDYRAEYTSQTTAVSATQIDGEVGLTLGESSRVAVGFFDATEDFNQLYPTGHKWLGNADVLSRRNIMGGLFRYFFKASDELAISGAYYWFNRHSESQPGYLFDGSAMANRSSAKELGQELDLEISFRLEKQLSLSVGYADFKPGAYVSEQYSSIDPVKWYVQVLAEL
ncbi:MAG: alginate export family protein [Parachlamydiales bacterium]